MLCNRRVRADTGVDATSAWRRFDFPGVWGGLLGELAAVAAWATPSAPPAKHRALVALKTVVRALAGRPGGVVVPAGRPLLQQGAAALLAGWVAAGACRACCNVSGVACMHGRSGRRACWPRARARPQARAGACMHEAGRPSSWQSRTGRSARAACQMQRARDTPGPLECCVSACGSRAPSASLAGMQSVGLRAADLRALLETAAQEAQTTVDAAGELFKALQAEWQARGPAAAAAPRTAGAPGSRALPPALRRASAPPGVRACAGCPAQTAQGPHACWRARQRLPRPARRAAGARTTHARYDSCPQAGARTRAGALCGRAAGRPRRGGARRAGQPRAAGLARAAAPAAQLGGRAGGGYRLPGRRAAGGHRGGRQRPRRRAPAPPRASGRLPHACLWHCWTHQALAAARLRSACSACGGARARQPVARAAARPGAERAGPARAGGGPGGGQGERAFERLAACALAALLSNPEGFEPHLPPALRLFLDAALLAVDAEAVRAARAKRRLMLVRFLAAALACPEYERRPGRGGGASPAAAAIAALLAGPPCAALLEALVAKYLVVSPDELAELEARARPRRALRAGRAPRMNPTGSPGRAAAPGRPVRRCTRAAS